MNEKLKTPSKRRRRNCFDRLRARWLEKRRHQRVDPAASAVAQMMAMFVVLIGRMPLVPAVPVPTPYVPPPLSPGQAHRNAVARCLGVPSRYVDVVLAQGTAPYGLLFEHIRRGGRSRDDAMAMLRQRAPEDCRDWLDHVRKWGLWSSLLACHLREGADEDTDVNLLKSTLAWLRDLNPGGGPPAPADAGVDLIPGPDDEPDNDPNRPRGFLT